MEAFHTHPHGKLLLTAEYAVLDGALALALPTRYGQSLAVEEGQTAGKAVWQSLDYQGNAWFEATFALPDFSLLSCTDDKTGTALEKVLQTALSLRTSVGSHQSSVDCKQAAETKPSTFDKPSAFSFQPSALHITARLDFPRNWGLGSSSTLIAAVARWFGVDPFLLLADTFGGSGYDIACAYAEGPITYRVRGEQATITPVVFDPVFKDQLYFVYLGKKQDSRAGIRYYREQLTDATALVHDISELTKAVLVADTLDAFESLLLEHEHRLAEALNLDRAQALHFEGYKGVVKSLGAWGGDFVLCTSHDSEQETRARMAGRGFDTVISWKDMILGPQQSHSHDSRLTTHD